MSKHTTVEERKAVRRTQQRLRRANALIKEAATLVPGERKCNGKVKVKDENGNVILDENGRYSMRPCTNAPIKGGTVCPAHGGRIDRVKKNAARRLAAMVEPSLVRLEALIQQEEHLPTALGAIRTVLERAGDAAVGPLKTKVDVDTRPIINIGIAVGGVPGKAPDVKVGLIPGATATNAEIVEDDGDEE